MIEILSEFECRNFRNLKIGKTFYFSILKLILVDPIESIIMGRAGRQSYKKKLRKQKKSTQNLNHPEFKTENE